MRHVELHRTDRIGWLRAAVLGANDGIGSTVSLIVGVAAAETTHRKNPGTVPGFIPMQPAGGSIETVLRVDRIDELDRLTAKTNLVNQSTRSAVNLVNPVQNPSPLPQSAGAFVHSLPLGIDPGTVPKFFPGCHYHSGQANRGNGERPRLR